MHRIVELYEQRGYVKREQHSETQSECPDMHNEIRVHRGRVECPCLSYRIEDGVLTYETSYFIGLDWILENEVAAFVKPKMDNADREIDYMSMLLYALKNIDSHKHLTDLVHIHFDKPFIEIEQTADELSPFIIIQYISLLRKLVQRGLKRSYYIVDENLNSMIKGKVLIGQDVKINRVKGKAASTYCRYQYYGCDSEENRILKKAFTYACMPLERSCMRDNEALRNMIGYIRPAFDGISDMIDVARIKHYRPDPLYPEYEECMRLALLLLKRLSYSVKPICRDGVQYIATPPYWIDMSKLFELYVYQRLLELFPKAEVRYHEHMNYQELDILFNGGNQYRYVIDVKYKPRYEEDGLSMDDIRQVSGYARMRDVYSILGFDYDKVIPALIIYPTINDNDLDISLKCLKRDDRYVNIYKCSIKLPTTECR